ncbi:MAG: hypothetical protein KDD44_11375 [Bdellovibrionales bacterium]|nr:hypothetical protein [Bdellovibrionales bacterium]
MRNLLPQFESVPGWVLVTGPAFLLLFVVIVYVVYRRDRKQFYDRVEKLPLEDDEQVAHDQRSLKSNGR